MSAGGRGRTEVIPEVVFLGKLVERITAGKIRVPRFQRTFVWRQADLHTLLDSVLRGFPIGSILIWETEEAVETTKNIGPIEIGPPPDGMVGYLLDGQQRVSTLVGTLRLPDNVTSIVDQVDWRIYCDLDTGEFLRAPARVEPQHFPVRSLLDTPGFFAACRRIQTEVDDQSRVDRWLGEADRLANAFRDYQLPVIRIREADLDSAVTVFARLNRTGRKMTADEMISALTYQEGQFHLAEKLDEFKDELARRWFGKLNRVLLLRAVLAALDRDIYAKDWADLMIKPGVRNELPGIFDAVVAGIRGALDFLEGLGVQSERLLPYGLQLVLLGEFFRLCPSPDDKQRELLKRWFWVTSFTGWFGSVNTPRTRHALSEIRDLAKGAGTGFTSIDLDTPARPFPERFDGRSARVRAFLLYLATLQPRSLEDNRELDPGRRLVIRGTRALGYVLSSQGALGELFSSPANRMFVNDTQAGQTFEQLVNLSESRLDSLLPTHGFPATAKARLRERDRAGLIEQRLANLIAGEREFMEQHNVMPPTERTAASIADSDVLEEEE